ncbi:MAG: polyprenol monophosphomannose synthase [Microthrixaceae bacterium]
MSTAIVLPTYQEAGTIDTVLRRIRAALDDAEIFVFDDSSPDGTADIAEKTGVEVGNITVVRRPAKEGLGAAYRHALTHVRSAGHDPVIHMDVDLSHDPARLPALIEALEDGADVAIGSRYVSGGDTPDWPLHRRVLSRYGNRYAQAMLHLSMHDATGGFRAYRGSVLDRVRVESTRTNGYGFMIETGFRLSFLKAVVTEVPIVFVDRTVGESKMSVRSMVETTLMVTWWGLCLRFPGVTDRFRATKLGRRLFALTGPSIPTGGPMTAPDTPRR